MDVLVSSQVEDSELVLLLDGREAELAVNEELDVDASWLTAASQARLLMRSGKFVDESDDEDGSSLDLSLEDPGERTKN